ncbi:HD domain-containing protein [Ruegeria sp. 2012CJ41-6]|uniref:HD domain-containing protein n=1 Tax=Ruegeria spongiae TaxID=2942209 RepID=A0ABT0Q4V2_9RHOB|nr:HD domain-containing protein [Ruegeria spongiae]MCL6284889.1 HD domain-containing protein [Ruegeria spongiae]
MAISADLRAHLRAVTAERMAQDPAHDVAHLDRVWANAQAIDDGSADPRILLAASYLHDLVNLPKDHPDRAQASRMSAKAAEPILRDCGFTADQIAGTRHAIEAHSFSAGIPPESPEARILRDADRLDALGAIGIARAFSVAGSLHRALYEPADPFCKDRAPDDSQFALDHWRIKLLALPDDMLTTGGRALAEKRKALMLSFLHELAAEIGSAVPENWG